MSTIKKHFILILVIVFLCALFLRIFVVEGFVVKGDSMDPVIQSGDYVFVNKLAYRWSKPARGDIVVAKSRVFEGNILKRIIGLPGERFQIKDNVILIKNDRLDPDNVLSEPYLSSNTTTPAIGTTLVKLDPQEYFVLGDNRKVSIDSRELGPIDKWSILGKVIGVFDIKNFKYKGF